MRNLFKTAAVTLGVLLSAGGALATASAASAEGYPGYHRDRYEHRFEHRFERPVYRDYRYDEARRWEARRDHRDYRGYRYGHRFEHRGYYRGY